MNIICALLGHKFTLPASYYEIEEIPDCPNPMYFASYCDRCGARGNPVLVGYLAEQKPQPEPAPRPITYDSLQVFLKAAIEGYIASSKGKFPPHNPYAICGMYPGDENTNLEGAAWFFGYWERSYCRNGEEKVKIKSLVVPE